MVVSIRSSAHGLGLRFALARIFLLFGLPPCLRLLSLSGKIFCFLQLPTNPPLFEAAFLDGHLFGSRDYPVGGRPK